jgi:hypothetical protein
MKCGPKLEEHQEDEDGVTVPKDGYGEFTFTERSSEKLSVPSLAQKKGMHIILVWWAGVMMQVEKNGNRDR